MVVLWIFTLPRTLKKVSYLSMACKLSKSMHLITTTDLHYPAFVSICGAVFITMIGVGVDPAPNLHLDATVKVPFAQAFLSVTNIVFAYAGHVAFFSFISEFKDPTEFPKALFLLQATDTIMYLVVAIVVYRYTGATVSSPALSSTSDVVKKIAYGIALPTVSLLIPLLPQGLTRTRFSWQASFTAM
jgi:hypothetical protein